MVILKYSVHDKKFWQGLMRRPSFKLFNAHGEYSTYY